MQQSSARELFQWKLKMTSLSCGKIYSLRCRVVVLVFIILLVLYFLVNYGNISFSKMFLLTMRAYSRSNIYGIMFDAGSTGSRIHVFTFVKAKDGQLDLTDEYFHQVKPGLSAYANDPKKGAHSIEELLFKSKEIIPEDHWKLTPISLKATAGLRLLPSNSSKQLLYEVESLFRDSPFLLPGKSMVDIMDGPDEGLFAWITVNFLLGGLKKGSSKLFGTLDLGGGSTQITLNPVDPVTLSNSPEGFSRPLNIAEHQFTLYTHSYLGLGLMAARTSILQSGKTVKESDEKEVKRSPCLHSGFTDQWKFGDQSFDVGGVSSYGFSACMEQVRSFILEAKVHKPAGIDSIEMYAFSYYYDRAVELGLIDKVNGGTITVGDFTRGAADACSKESQSSPYLCLDTTFIVALLKEGFGFAEDRKLTLQKKIHDIEISWALGATLDLFHKMT